MKREHIVLAIGLAAAVLIALYFQTGNAPKPLVMPVVEGVPGEGPPKPLPAPVMFTAAQEHANEMKALGLTTLRRAAAPSFDEASAEQNLVLPDIMRMDDGKPLATTDDWWRVRRQEVADKVEIEIFGQLPNAAVILNWQGPTPTDDTINGVPVSARDVTSHLATQTTPSFSVDIKMKVFLPSKAAGPVPLMLLLAKSNEDVTAFRDAVLAKGWGVAILDVDSVQPESGDQLTRGVIGSASGGQTRDKRAWGVLRAWAWGASRAYEYFETDAKIDPARIGIAGYGRAGKAALIAAAYDPRYALAYIASPGATGVSPIRRGFGERVENLASVENFQFFGPNLLKYAGKLTAKDLPVDTHDLFALAAPHPIFIGASSAQDGPKGIVLAMSAADPLYKLLGREGLGTSTAPAPGTLLATGLLAFRQAKNGEGSGDTNLPHFLTFADRYFTKKP